MKPAMAFQPDLPFLLASFLPFPLKEDYVNKWRDAMGY